MRDTVGRSEHLATLDVAIARVTREGGFVGLEGDGGFGKTHLLDHAADRARAADVGVRWGRCLDVPGTPSGWPWPEVARDLGVGRPDTQDPFEWAETVVGRLVGAGPCLVLLDDLHLADDASLRVLDMLLPVCRAHRVLVIGAWRPTDRLDRAARLAERVSVGPLGTDAIAALVGVAPTEAARLAALTGGNPFLVLEVVRAERSGTRPTSAQRLVAEHVARAPAEAVAWATRCALAGGLPAEATSAPEATHGLAAALGAGLVRRADDGWRPTHDLLREALIARATPDELRAHHAAIARGLAPVGGRWRAAAVEHALIADVPGAVDDALTLAADAAAAGAWGDAARALAQVLRRPDLSDAVRADALHDLARARLLALDPAAEASRREAVAAARRTGDPQRFARAAITWGLGSAEGLVDAQHVTLLREALAGLPADDAVGRSRVMARLAAALQPALDPAEALALVDQSIALVRERGTPRERLDVLSDARRALRVAEPLAPRIAIDEECLDLARRLGDDRLYAVVLQRLVLDAWEAGDGLRADRYRHELDDRLAAFDTPRALATIDRLEAAWLTAQGDHEQARARWTAAASRPFPPSVALPIAFQGLWLAWWWRAEDLLTEPPRAPGPPGLLASAMAAARVGRLTPEVLAEVRHFARLAPPTAGLRGCLVRIAVDHGDPELARVTYAALLPDRDRGGVWPGWIALDGAHERSLGELATTFGDHAAAREHLAAGLVFDRRLGAAGFVARGERLLAELDGGPRPTRPTGRRGDFGCVREGDTWRVTAGGRSARLVDSDGLRYLAHLLARPGVDVPALDLVALSRAAERREPGAPDAGDAGPAADAKALAAWRSELRALRERQEDAEERGDLRGAARLEAEIERLAAHVGAVTGLGGGARRVGSAAERARATVTQRIRHALARLREVDPALGHDVAACIKTGTTCRFDPPPLG